MYLCTYEAKWLKLIIFIYSLDVFWQRNAKHPVFRDILLYSLQVAYLCIVMIHYDDVIMSTIASQITSLTIVYSTIYSGADQSKDQSSASLAFVWGIHRGPVNSPHKCPVTRKMFPFDDVIMYTLWMNIEQLLHDTLSQWLCYCSK